MTFYTDDIEIDEIVRGFLTASLPREDWTHAAHFAVTLWLLRHRPERTRLANMCGLIRAYNDATGTANTPSSGYHETITIASLQAAKLFLDICPPDMPLCQILNALMAGPPGKSDWLLAFWNRETLFSPEARAHWVAPDKAPLALWRPDKRMECL